METQVRHFVTQYGINDRGGCCRMVECFIVTDAKAQVAVANCKGRKATSAAAAMCWVCGKALRACLADFAIGTSRIADLWGCYRQVLADIPPGNRGPDLPLHGLQRLVFTGLHAPTNALIEEHSSLRTRAVE